ncbi:3-hydroxyisobutyrate dehydrogenase-like beta-hydroxyacid dehydrogenase [Saccharopolyspora phatthalungensis]|uniref:3-hydroxyisobutyrate dehydrogenase-like beta-hydroxyacid dehydrogenase n=1 Tax=Saccharopolyspora phatthalungensis TaxID=664693 RepID=A0A840QBK3_9PSEU|nr:3-hydroxyisobutyrate dehydrogenase-like beta-hydroxyacid dehydrogenase [Saccharopolyspora phatthalungensis]
MTTVGFLGLGRMGAPMAARLVAAGLDVAVWNRTAGKAEAFAADHGTRIAATPAKAAENADFVISMLADDAVVETVHTGPDGVFAAADEGTVVIGMSTVSPVTTRKLAEAAVARGLRFVDAPVSGSTAAAESGTLTILCAGEQADVAAAEQVLSPLGKKIVHLGSNGAGAAMKLAVNTVVHGLNNAVSEALVLAERAGIDRTAAYGVFLESAIAAPFVAYRQAAFERPAETPVAFLLDLAIKDLRLALELAEDVGAELPQAEKNVAIFREASRAGYGEHDESAVAQFLRAEGGVA